MFDNRSGFREGDFIESVEGLIFDVKGLVHPPDKVIAFVRYIPSPDGERKRGDKRYLRLYELDDRFAFIKKGFPQYLRFDPVFGEELMEVPRERVVNHYIPRRRLAELLTSSNVRPLEAKALELVDFLADSAAVPIENFGISGSLLVDLASSSSDLDLIVYGAANALRVSSALKGHFEAGKRIRGFNLEELKLRFMERCKDSGVSFEDYVFHERRKSFEGFFDGTEFFVRYLKDASESKESYGENVYTPIGRAQISGIVEDVSDDVFTPCFYEVKDVTTLLGAQMKPLVGIASFRGRFCQQALAGERVIACGKLERVLRRGDKAYYRLIVGNRPEDFMVTVR